MACRNGEGKRVFQLPPKWATLWHYKRGAGEKNEQ